MATVCYWDGDELTPASTAIGEEDSTGRRRAARFSGTVDANAIYEGVAPSQINLGSAPVADLYWWADGISGNVLWEVEVEAVTPNADTTNMRTTASFDAANVAAAAAVSGSTGGLIMTSVTLTNNDGMAAQDVIRLRITRNADGAGDTNNDAVHLHRVVLRDAA